MEKNGMNHRVLGMVAVVFTVGLTLLASGCGNKPDDSAATTAPTVKSADVPASASKAGQGTQQYSAAQGQDAAANAAAYKAAKEKAEGK